MHIFCDVGVVIKYYAFPFECITSDPVEKCDYNEW